MKEKILLSFSVLVLFVLSTSLVFAAPTVMPRGDRGQYAPGEVLVGFKASATPDQIEAAISSVGGKLAGKNNLPNTKIRRVKIFATDRAGMEQVIQSLKTFPFVKYAEPNIIKWAHGGFSPTARVQAQTGDPLLSGQWGYYDIGANWLTAPVSTTAPLVAVVDTGVDYTHPDLVGKVVKGYDYVNADADPMDDYGHGTQVSGIIAAKTNNAYGIAGISWNSKILAIKVLNSQGWGTDFDISLGITAAANNLSVKVINMSLGGPYSPIEDDAVYYAVVTKEKLLVASAGNNNTNTPSYPAGLSEFYPGRVIAVAAHGIDHCKADFGGGYGSNYGNWVSITAPGVDIISTVPPSMGYTGFDSWSGTSMAAPHVSGAAAVAWAKYPTLSNTGISSLLTTQTATNTPLIRDDICWPDDMTSFERLEIFHIIDPTHYEECTKMGILGYAFDAETGEPLTGAKVTTKQGTKVTGVDYVPYYGEVTNLFDSSVYEGYGLFQVYMNTTATTGHSMQIQKPKYPSFNITGIPTAPCNWTYAGNIPVPPNKDKYWLTVTWDNGYNGASYDSYLYVPGYDDYIDPYWNVGTPNALPWAKALWDSDDVLDQLYGTRRAYSEAIKIKKTVTGQYFFYIWDHLGDHINGAVDSTSWSASGIKVYIYRWDPATLTQKLVKTYTPPAGAGQYWNVCYINGNTVTDINTLSND